MQNEARRLLVGLDGGSVSSGDADESLMRACATFAALPNGTTAANMSRSLGDIAKLHATTLGGHRARAAAFILWDEGDLLGRAIKDSILEEILLRAILVDLVRAAP